MKLISTKRVRQKLGDISNATFFDKFRHDPSFPRPVRISQNRLGYVEEEVDGYIQHTLIAEHRVQQRRREA